jgi:hypothetical protein
VTGCEKVDEHIARSQVTHRRQQVMLPIPHGIAVDLLTNEIAERFEKSGSRELHAGEGR